MTSRPDHETEDQIRRPAASPTSDGGHATRQARRSSMARGAPPDQNSSIMLRALGQMVRHLRQERGLAQTNLSAAAGISTGMMSKIENGHISPSLATVQALAKALGAPLSSLFLAFEERRDSSYVPRGMGITGRWRGSKSGFVCQLLGSLLHGDIAVEPCLVWSSDGAQSSEGRVYPGMQFIYMIQGQVIYRYGDQRIPLQPGDALLFDTEKQHGTEDPDRGPIVFLSLVIGRRDVQSADLLRSSAGGEAKLNRGDARSAAGPDNPLITLR